jgi:hypothetical protein
MARFHNYPAMKRFELAIVALVIVAILFTWHHHEAFTNVLMPIFRNIADGLIG